MKNELDWTPIKKADTNKFKGGVEDPGYETNTSECTVVYRVDHITSGSGGGGGSFGDTTNDGDWISTC